MSTERTADEQFVDAHYERLGFEIGSRLATLAASSATRYHEIEEGPKSVQEGEKENHYPEISRLSKILEKARDTLTSEHATLTYNESRDQPSYEAPVNSETLRMTLDLMFRYGGSNLSDKTTAEATKIAIDFYEGLVSRLQAPEEESQYTAVEMKNFCLALAETASTAKVSI